ncbi:MAG: mechanosensitive ion channel [Candidatus Nanohaloarchaea archaeon]|nr:mechanosensitive ion channel [Candidatus Nanohaloarchaea archaeon]
MLHGDLIGGAGVYFQLARFFLVFVLGLAVTRAVAMPIVSRLVDETDKKRFYSAANLVGVIGVFVSLTVELQAAAFGNLVTVLGTVAAALTIAIGFGMREQVGHLVSGLFIQLDNPFVKGDYIQSEKVDGTVKEIKLRETRVRSPTGETVSVPNSYLSNNPVQNRTRGRVTTDTFTVHVPMDTAEQAEELFHEVVEDNENVLDDPSPAVFFADISDDDEVVMQFRYAIRDSDNTKEVRDALLRVFTRELVDNGLVRPGEAS